MVPDNFEATLTDILKSTMRKVAIAGLALIPALNASTRPSPAIASTSVSIKRVEVEDTVSLLINISGVEALRVSRVLIPETVDLRDMEMAWKNVSRMIYNISERYETK